MHRTRVFVDESFHQSHDFVVCAYFFADEQVDDAIVSSFRKHGLVAGVDEVKASGYMQRNPRLAEARSALRGIASCGKLGVYVGPCSRAETAKGCLWALDRLIHRNGIDPYELQVYFDSGLLGRSDVSALLPGFGRLREVDMSVSADSRTVLGIQVADVVANAIAQVIKAELDGVSKLVDIGDEDAFGYEPGTLAPLPWCIIMELRYAFFSRPWVRPGEPVQKGVRPVVLASDEDVAAYSQEPTLLGWGVHVLPSSQPRVHKAVRTCLRTIWLGCIH